MTWCGLCGDSPETRVPAEYVVNFHPVCEHHVVDQLDAEFHPPEGRGSVAVPVSEVPA